MAKKIIDIEETIFDLERISGGITCGLESLDEQLVSFGIICCEYELEMDAHSVESLEKMYDAYKNYVDYNRQDFENILRFLNKSISMLESVKDIINPSQLECEDYE